MATTGRLIWQIAFIENFQLSSGYLSVPAPGSNLRVGEKLSRMRLVRSAQKLLKFLRALFSPSYTIGRPGEGIMVGLQKGLDYGKYHRVSFLYYWDEWINEIETQQYRDAMNSVSNSKIELPMGMRNGG